MSSQALTPKDLRVLEQFRKWSPMCDMNFILEELKIQREKIINTKAF